MCEDRRDQEVAQTERKCSGNDEAIAACKLDVGEDADTGNSDGGEEESRNAAEDGVRNGEKDSRYLAQDTKKDEENAAPTPSGAIGTACDGNDSIVLDGRVTVSL